MINDLLYLTLSDIERAVWDWLAKREIQFVPQEKMYGGIGELGSAVVDYILPDRMIALRIQGTYWHEMTATKAKDILQKERLVADGYMVVDIWEEDLTAEKIDYTMRRAIEGEAIPR